MKTVFIVNPKAGKGWNVSEFSKNIQSVADSVGAEVLIYETKAVRDAERFVREYTETKGAARFIACGGDGTLSEVLNGAISCKEAEIGVVPVGTGNDFCRNFEDCDFHNIALQMSSETRLCDAIYYETRPQGKLQTGYCINMFNVGFDCNVAAMVADMKKKPFISGSLAYVLSIFVNLIQKKGADLTVCVDGEEVHKGPLLLNSVANGCYCGGGIKGSPVANLYDGEMDINIIKNMPRLRFLRLLPHYMKGTHLGLPGIEKLIDARRCRQLTIIPNHPTFVISCDGEIVPAGETNFQIVPEAFRFVVPKIR